MKYFNVKFWHILDDFHNSYYLLVESVSFWSWISGRKVFICLNSCTGGWIPEHYFRPEDRWSHCRKVALEELERDVEHEEVVDQRELLAHPCLLNRDGICDQVHWLFGPSGWNLLANSFSLNKRAQKLWTRGRRWNLKQ